MTKRTTALAAIAASLGLGTALAVASIPDSGGTIHACYTTTGSNIGSLRVIEPGGGGPVATACSGGTELPINFNQMGPTGARGTTGPRGADGADGPTGGRGPTGPRGADGAAGAAGVAGPSGPRGSNGEKGPIGPTGPAGKTGPKGQAGPKGPVGPTGVKPRVLSRLKARIGKLEARVKALGG